MSTPDSTPPPRPSDCQAPARDEGSSSAEAAWVLSSPLRAAASWVFLMAALAAVDTAWTYSEVSRRTERDVRAVRSSGAHVIRFERRYYTQDEIIAMLRARRWRAAVPLGCLTIALAGCGVVALRHPRAGTATALGVTLAGAAVAHEIAPWISARGVVFFLCLFALAGLGLRGALGFHRLERGPPRGPPTPGPGDESDRAAP